MNKLILKQILSNFGFALTLLGMSVTISGGYKFLGIGLSAAIAVFSCALFFEKTRLEPVKIVRRWVIDWDFSYIMFGIGLMLNAVKLMDIGIIFGVVLALAGLLFSAYFIGQFIGKPLAPLIKSDARFALAISLIITFVGIFYVVTYIHVPYALIDFIGYALRSLIAALGIISTINVINKMRDKKFKTSI